MRMRTRTRTKAGVRTIRWLGTLLILSFLAALILAQAQAGEGGKPEEHHPKIDSALEQILQMAQAGMSVSAMNLAMRAGIPAQGNSITVVLELAPSLRGPLAQLVVSAVAQLAPGLIVANTDRFIKLRLPLGPGVLQIVEAILELTGIAYVRPPAVPQALTVSEGVELTGAASYQASGYRGQGVKIAVIDLGFAGLSAAQARGELPSTVRKFDYTGTGLEAGTSHGTAVAEIVHDMAPEAELYLMKIGDEVDLDRAVADAIHYGVKIINHSVGWFNTNFYDGRGVVAEIAAGARARGILWVNAAGNYARRHWKGYFRDSDHDGWCEFSGGDEDLEIQVRGGELIQLYLTWNDWPASAQDYDLYLLDGRGRQVAISDKLQTGTEEPTEAITYRAPSSGTYRIKIRAYRVSSHRELALFSLNHDLEHAVPQSSIVAPGNSSAVLTVGAIDYRNWASGPAEPYSSQGPTADGRQKPDLSAPDRVSTSTLGQFAGTSAAAPHVAGAAALLLSANPGWTAAQLEAKLKGEAIGMGSPLVYGAGRLNLEPVPQVTPARLPDLVIAGVSYTPLNPTIGDQLTFTVQVRNQGEATAGSFAVEIRDSHGADRRTVGGLAAGATARVNFTRRISTASETYTITVDAAGQVSEKDETNNVYQVTVRASQPPPQPPPPANRPPVASFTFNPSEPVVGQPVSFDASGSYDPDGRIVHYQWDLDGDGRVDASGVRTSYTYSQARTYRVSLIVTDDGGLTATASAQLEVRPAPAPPPSPSPPSGTLPSATLAIDRGCGATYQPGERITITFSVSESAQVKLFDFTTAGGMVLLATRSLGAGQQGNLTGQVVGPYGIETLVLLARTTSGTVTTAACSFVIGQAGGSISLSIDRGPGGSYRVGEPIRFTYTVSEDAALMLYDFEPSGLLRRIGLGWASGGQTRSFAATIVGPPGVETAVLVAYTRSGRVLTTAVSWQVLP